MRRVLGADYDQMLLLAPVVEDWIGERHPARFVREFVAALDLKALGLDTLDREEGGVAYEPALLLQAWVYGYYRKIRSTRAIEAACQEDMGFVWLTGNHRPDHNALWRFWSAHHPKIKELFKQSVRVAIELELVGMAVQAVDGTKIMAASSGRKRFNQEDLEKLLRALDEQLKEREAQIAAAGNEGAAALTPELARAAELRTKVRAALERVKQGQTKHAHPLEPEAARMECDGRNRFGYNAQAVVDAKAQVIVAAEATNAPNDSAQLVPMVAESKEMMPQATPTTLADGGYANAAQLSTVAQQGHEVVTPPPSSWRDTTNPYHAAHFRHDAARQVVICPQGRELPRQRVRQKDGRPVEVYRSAKACKDCPVRAQCTKDRHGRTIDIQPGHEAVVASHVRWQQPSTAELYGLRAPTVEPVFGQCKQQMGFRRWTVRGLTKVRSQWAMLALTWNLRVIFRRWQSGSRGSGPILTPSGPAGRPTGRSGFASVTSSPRLPALTRFFSRPSPFPHFSFASP